MDGTKLAGIAALPVVVDRQVLVPTAVGRLISLIGASDRGEDHGESAATRGDRVLGW